MVFLCYTPSIFFCTKTTQTWIYRLIRLAFETVWVYQFSNVRWVDGIAANFDLFLQKIVQNENAVPPSDLWLPLLLVNMGHVQLCVVLGVYVCRVYYAQVSDLRLTELLWSTLTSCYVIELLVRALKQLLNFVGFAPICPKTQYM